MCGRAGGSLGQELLPATRGRILPEIVEAGAPGLDGAAEHEEPVGLGVPHRAVPVAPSRRSAGAVGRELLPAARGGVLPEPPNASLGDAYLGSGLRIACEPRLDGLGNSVILGEDLRKPA